jgi:hypothetical protein
MDRAFTKNVRNTRTIVDEHKEKRHRQLIFAKEAFILCDMDHDRGNYELQEIQINQCEYV